MIEQRAQVVEFARSLLGVKWRHQGRTTWAVDCVGLVYLSLKAAGLNVADERAYGRTPFNNSLQFYLAQRFGAPVLEAQWQPGDIAVFKSLGGEPRHVGILADYRYGGFSLVHAHVQHNVAEHALNDTWRRLLVEVYSPWAI